MTGRTAERLAPWLLTLAMIVVWEAGVRLFDVPPVVLPTASASFYAVWEFREALWHNAVPTLLATLLGFGAAVVFGVALGVFIGVSRPVYAALYPLLVAFNSIPKVAIVPILMVWFGIGMTTATITAFILCFFPIVVNVAVAFATIEPELKDVLRALGAHERDIVLKIGIPRSLPYLFASLKIAITLAFVGAVIAETVAGGDGIGHLMLVASSNFNIALMIAGLIVIAAMAIGMYAVFAAMDRRFTGWATRDMAYATGG